MRLNTAASARFFSQSHEARMGQAWNLAHKTIRRACPIQGQRRRLPAEIMSSMTRLIINCITGLVSFGGIRTEPALM
jgi:hypothetical protein